MVEFDWIFKGEEGLMFVEELAFAIDDQILKLHSIQVCIKFLWSFYFWKIFFWVFLPYIAFFIIFLTYSTIIYDGENKGFEVNYILGSLSIAYCTVIMIMEMRQILN